MTIGKTHPLIFNLNVFVRRIETFIILKKGELPSFGNIMSSMNHLSRSFSQLYCDIDKIETQISKISCNASLSTVDSNSVATENHDKKSQISTAQLDEIINAAKEFNRETKKFTNEEKKKSMEKTKGKRAKSIYLKSTMPPIWDKKKLDSYIENVMNELDVSLDVDIDTDVENTKSDEVKQTKSILKNNPRNNLKRNIGTNVKFFIEKKVDETQKRKPEKAQKINHPSIKSDISVMTDTEIFNQKKNLTDHHSRDSTKSSFTLTKKPSELMFSPLTVTSTNCSIDNYENINDTNNIVESNLATAHGVKQMTKCVLPSLSVKGSCKIQRIYQLEISPTPHALQKNESCENKNVRFYTFSHPSSITQQKPQEQKREYRDASQETDRFEREVNVFEGKVHFVLDNKIETSTTAKKEKKKNFGKLKPSSLNKFKNAPTPSKNKTSIKHDELKTHKIQKNKIEFFDSDSTSIYYSSSSNDEEVTKAVLNQMSNSTKFNRKASPSPKNCKKIFYCL